MKMAVHGLWTRQGVSGTRAAEHWRTEQRQDHRESSYEKQRREYGNEEIAMPDELGDEGKLINTAGSPEVAFGDDEAEPIVADPAEVEAARVIQSTPPPSLTDPLPPGWGDPTISAGPENPSPTFPTESQGEDFSLRGEEPEPVPRELPEIEMEAP